MPMGACGEIKVTGRQGGAQDHDFHTAVHTQQRIEASQAGQSTVILRDHRGRQGWATPTLLAGACQGKWSWV